jgi:hypothetical protein
LGTHQLIPHPATPPASIEAVAVEIVATDYEHVLLRFVVTGRAGLLLPEWVASERSDGLWNATCFELFLRPAAAAGYFEFNFSTQWAAYSFAAYRAGKSDLPLSVAPHIASDGDDARYVLEAEVDLSDLSDSVLRMGLCAVIEERDGRKSYWALAHPAGDPDFHHQDCFALELAAAQAP